MRSLQSGMCHKVQGCRFPNRQFRPNAWALCFRHRASLASHEACTCEAECESLGSKTRWMCRSSTFASQAFSCFLASCKYLLARVPSLRPDVLERPFPTMLILFHPATGTVQPHRDFRNCHRIILDFSCAEATFASKAPALGLSAC